MTKPSNNSSKAGLAGISNIASIKEERPKTSMAKSSGKKGVASKMRP